MLRNFAALPNHDHTEASDRLLSWATDRADEEQAICCVAGEESEPRVRLCEKKGFVKQEERPINISSGGMELSYKYVAMVRAPKEMPTR